MQKAVTYRVELTGQTPLLMHHDNIQWAEEVHKWRKDPANKKASKAGDDRSPAWQWIGYLYTERDQVVIPADNLMTVLREGGNRCPKTEGKGTLKAQTQSGIVVNQSSWPLTIKGAIVQYNSIKALVGNREFIEHEALAAKCGFSLFVKRAKINKAKHLRVRPRFDCWECQGTVTVFDEMITAGVLRNILEQAGTYCGIGDWRPSSPSAPGPFGKFTSVVSLV